MPGRPRCSCARPASSARRSRSHNPAAGKGPVDAKSILSVLTLGVSSGTEIEVSAEGDDAEAALAAIREAVERGLGEDPGAAA